MSGSIDGINVLEIDDEQKFYNVWSQNLLK